MRWRWEDSHIAELARLLGRTEAGIRAELVNVQNDAHPVEELIVYRLGRRHGRCRVEVLGRVAEGSYTVLEVLPAHAAQGSEQRSRPSHQHRDLARRLRALGVVISPAQVRDMPHDDRREAEAWAGARDKGQEPALLPACLKGVDVSARCRYGATRSHSVGDPGGLIEACWSAHPERCASALPTGSDPGGPH